MNGGEKLSETEEEPSSRRGGWTADGGAETIGAAIIVTCPGRDYRLQGRQCRLRRAPGHRSYTRRLHWVYARLRTRAQQRRGRGAGRQRPRWVPAFGMSSPPKEDGQSRKRRRPCRFDDNRAGGRTARADKRTEKPRAGNVRRPGQLPQPPRRAAPRSATTTVTSDKNLIVP